MPVPTGQQQTSPWSNKHRSVYVPVDVCATSSINISFKDITLTARGSGIKSKQILKGLNGKFKSGELTAIMGPSGAGKSSLLNILTGFRTEGMRGTIMSNDNVVEASNNTVRKQSAYIMQDDNLSPYFTVREIMLIASHLKLGSSITPKAKLLIIDDILDNLFMADTKDTPCRNLSGGQRKRLSIALEVIDNPNVLYLDEPTTGLDSSSTLQLINLLSGMAREGKAVICTIHQPSATIFEMFDHVYIISDGRCVYQGCSKNVVPFLDSINLPCPKYHNPADFMLDVVSGEFGDYMDKLRMNGSNPVWRESVQDKKDGKLDVNWNVKTLKQAVLITPPSELHKVFILMKTILIQMHRNWTNTYLKLGLHIVLGALVGLFYQNVAYYGDKTIPNVGYFMAMLVYISFLTMLPATITFPGQLKIIIKERFNNWYNFKTYFVAFFIVNSSVQVLLMWIFVVTTFFLSSQYFDVYRISLFLAVGAMSTLFTEYLGLTLGTMSNPANAIFNGSVYLACCMTLAGFGILIKHMPAFFYYLSYGSFMRFAFEALVTAAYGLDRPHLPCPDNVLYCQVKEPSIVIDKLGLDEKHLSKDLAILLGYTIGMIALSFLFIRKTVKSG